MCIFCTKIIPLFSGVYHLGVCVGELWMSIMDSAPLHDKSMMGAFSPGSLGMPALLPNCEVGGRVLLKTTVLFAVVPF